MKLTFATETDSLNNDKVFDAAGFNVNDRESLVLIYSRLEVAFVPSHMRKSGWLPRLHACCLPPENQRGRSSYTLMDPKRQGDVF